MIEELDYNKSNAGECGKGRLQVHFHEYSNLKYNSDKKIGMKSVSLLLN